MKFASAVSTRPVLQDALDESLGLLMDQLDAPIDLAVLFFAGHDAADLDRCWPETSRRLGKGPIIGCTCESVICDRQEFEWQAAVSVWAASLPGTQVDVMHLAFQTIGDDSAFAGWTERLAGPWPSDSAIITVSDPYTFPMERLLERINDDYPGVPVLGGMASGGVVPGQNRLIFGERLFDHGAIVVRLAGGVEVSSLVSQGCRPIGDPMVVTGAEANRITHLGGRPALSQLEAIYRELPTRDQRLVNSGLHIGRVIDEYRERFGYGDFLIRNVLGADPTTGAVAVADFLRVGQTVQFHVRDQDSAHAELQQLLSQLARRDGAPARTWQARGALLFSCNGRGSRLFGQPHHDADLVQQFLGPIPLAGMFAAGEVGPVSGRNFLHGFTSSIAIMHPPRTVSAAGSRAASASGKEPGAESESA
jgi:small ligand-binding sensory domain FIST